MVPQGQTRNDKILTKTDANLSRAKTAVEMLFQANSLKTDGRYFWTGTFGSNVTEYADAVNAWKRFVRVLRDRFPQMSYITVPEIQEKRAVKYGFRVWHFHAMIWGLDMPYCLKVGKCVTGEKWDIPCENCCAVGLMTRQCWQEANGGGLNIDEAQAVRSGNAISKYVRKYVTKTTFLDVPKGRKIYFAGGRLLKRMQLTRYTVCDEIPDEPGVLADSQEYNAKFAGPMVKERYDLRTVKR